MVQFDTLIELPEDEDIIWRYLSFSRFAAMLENGGVFFPRAHLFEDQWEGSLSSQNLEVRRESLAEAGVDESRVNSLLGTSSGFNEWNRQWMLVSCWHLDDVESDAMWRLYGSGEGRLALRSSVGRLRGVLPDDIQVGRVNYIDYATDAIPQGNILFPYFHKRTSFKHEHELRAVRWDRSRLTQVGHVDLSIKAPDAGEWVKVDLTVLFESLFVSPEAPPWFATLLRQVLERYGLSCSVHYSRLANDPVF